MQSLPEFPPPDIHDSQEVAWALCTAAALWRRGDFSDAVTWLQRAASTAAREQAQAEAADSNVRVVMLTIAATEVSAYVANWAAAGGEHPSSVRISQLYADAPSIELHSADLQSLSALPPSPLGSPPAKAPRENVLATTLAQDARRPAWLDQKLAKVESAPLPPRKTGLSETLPDGTANPLAPPTVAPVTPLVIDFGASVRSQKVESAPISPISPISSDAFVSFDLTASSSEQPRDGAPTTKPVPSDEEYPPKEAVPSRPESVPTRRVDDPAYPARAEADAEKNK